MEGLDIRDPVYIVIQLTYQMSASEKGRFKLKSWIRQLIQSALHAP